MLFEKNSRIVFAGDSVTDVGRDYHAIPAGWGSFGDGYVSQINSLLTAVYPDKEIMVVNKGVSGDNIALMANRWDNDVLAMEPDYVSIMIGVNDVWRFFDAPFQQLQAPNIVSQDLYEKTYRELIAKTQPSVKQMMIMSPFMIEPNRQDPMRHMVDAYRRIAERLARENHLIYVDVQAAVDHFLTQQSSYILTSDRVHPNVQGHMLVARTWLQTLGFDWERSTFDDH
ncbi:SGNH/GDSL hydrolase family protein [Schleiferilactobacillus harbinensis]|uniref:SGNH hydrolase-type esterase domain-containing protein n=1 Tax=Schleiferilactobacillus harbinensis TaxID=304207 RepID=A0A510TWC6_9LACO|nr:SGNH/GDSL hydrolase family protein [Schleiferilactobacillus harbinensis]QFR22399.1 hypothetical protein D1010_02455 [Schleiferilactobacillus harbinensis]GEK06574.1 lipase [Schleiferilactobacillus harbinensis]